MLSFWLVYMEMCTLQKFDVTRTEVVNRVYIGQLHPLFWCLWQSEVANYAVRQRNTTQQRQATGTTASTFQLSSLPYRLF